MIRLPFKLVGPKFDDSFKPFLKNENLVVMVGFIHSFMMTKKQRLDGTLALQWLGIGISTDVAPLVVNITVDLNSATTVPHGRTKKEKKKGSHGYGNGAAWQYVYI